jgi:hypothetical protein
MRIWVKECDSRIFSAWVVLPCIGPTQYKHLEWRGDIVAPPFYLLAPGFPGLPNPLARYLKLFHKALLPCFLLPGWNMMAHIIMWVMCFVFPLTFVPLIRKNNIYVINKHLSGMKTIISMLATICLVLLMTSSKMSAQTTASVNQDIPEDIRVADSLYLKLICTLDATGFQVYQCTKKEDKFSWEFNGPEAYLLDSTTNGFCNYLFYGRKKRLYFGCKWFQVQGVALIAQTLDESMQPSSFARPAAQPKQPNPPVTPFMGTTK